MRSVLVTYYVRPFQAATGTLSSVGSLDWFAVETVLAMSWCAVYVSLGLLAIRIIRNAYSPSSQ